MAKKNRRINLAKREAKQLREQLHAAQCASRGWTHQAELARSQERATAAELASLENRLRQFCRHFFILSPTGKVRPRDYKAAAPSKTAPDFYQMQDYQRRAFEAVRPVDLVHLLIEEQRNPEAPNFERYIHFTVEHPSGPNLRHAIAVSRDTLDYMRDQSGPQMLTEEILRGFGAALFAALQKTRQ